MEHGDPSRVVQHDEICLDACLASPRRALERPDRGSKSEMEHGDPSRVEQRDEICLDACLASPKRAFVFFLFSAIAPCGHTCVDVQRPQAPVHKLVGFGRVGISGSREPMGEYPGRVDWQRSSGACWPDTYLK